MQCRRKLALKLDAARRNVAGHMIAQAQENDPVTRRIRLVVFQLMVRNDNLCPNVDMSAAQRFIGPRVGNDGDVFVAIDFK